MVYHELEQWTWAQDIFSNANNKTSIKMTINLVNILVKNFPLKTLEMLFQRIKISNFSGGARPQIYQ